MPEYKKIDLSKIDWSKFSKELTDTPMNYELGGRKLSPQTDEEVRQRCDTVFGDNKLFGDCIFGLYQVKRAQGMDVMAAWEYALRFSIGEIK